jgi:hypothetical protein
LIRDAAERSNAGFGFGIAHKASSDTRNTMNGNQPYRLAAVFFCVNG